MTNALNWKQAKHPLTLYIDNKGLFFLFVKLCFENINFARPSFEWFILAG